MAGHVQPRTMSNAMYSAMTTADRTNFTPKSLASVPRVFPPHPPLQSGGWYHGQTFEAPGPGRPPVDPPAEKSSTAAIALAAVFGPLGLFYLSSSGGAAATVLTVAVLSAAGMGFWPLLLLWPLSVAVAAWVTNY